MPINRDFIGREFPARDTYEVSRELIRRFADAIGDPNPAYRDVEAAKALGHPEVIAPPTFLTVLGFRFGGTGPLADSDLGLNYALVVHGEQRLVGRRHPRRRPQRADDHQDDHHDGRGRAGRRRLLHHRVARHRSGRGRRMTATVRYDDVEVGTALPAQTFTVQRANLVQYCGASGDFNVIHWNERVAKAVGLPNVIAHGMFTMAEAGRVVTDWAGDPGAVVEYGVRFSSPVVVPDDDQGATLEVSGVVAEKLDGRRVAVDLEARVDGSKVLTKARAVVALA
jgi:acyl dehydratase